MVGLMRAGRGGVAYALSKLPRALSVEDRRASDMTRRWFKFTVFSPEEEFGFETEGEAFEYAAILNADCDGGNPQ
jgi:hypothetical protein